MSTKLAFIIGLLSGMLIFVGAVSAGLLSYLRRATL